MTSVLDQAMHGKLTLRQIDKLTDKLLLSVTDQIS